jgi:hypothetical protein
MPWFITAIVGKKTLKKVPEYKHLNHRTFGFYNTYNEAYEAVNENRCDMHECLYDYIIVEYIEPGIHPLVHTKEWWQWDIHFNKWIALVNRPEEFDGLCNWALG